jgi:uncharacterized protein YdaU (DUF1376 family)
LYYYQHHIGDYRRDTGHLSLLEHGIYRQLLDLYYITEKPLDKTAAMRLICVRNTDECEAYYRVLTDFFQEIDGSIVHKRCDYEIVKFKDKSEKATKSIKTRWNKNKDLPDTFVLPTNNEGNTNLRTNKPINQDKASRKTAPAICPQDVPQSVWDDFVKQRASQKAPLTETALEGIRREAVKAGVTIEWALRECCSRGWRGFKSEWVPKAAVKSDDPNVMFGRRTK